MPTPSKVMAANMTQKYEKKGVVLCLSDQKNNKHEFGGLQEDSVKMAKLTDWNIIFFPCFSKLWGNSALL